MTKTTCHHCTIWINSKSSLKWRSKYLNKCLFTITWRKQFSCHAGCQEVSRCHTRGESEDSVAHRRRSTQTRGSKPGFETQGRCHQKSKTGAREITDVLQKIGVRTIRTFLVYERGRSSSVRPGMVLKEALDPHCLKAPSRFIRTTQNPPRNYSSCSLLLRVGKENNDFSLPLVFSLSYNPIKSKGFPEENHKFVNFLSWFSNPQSYCSACPWSVNPLTTVIRLKRCGLMMILNTQQHTALIVSLYWQFWLKSTFGTLHKTLFPADT